MAYESIRLEQPFVINNIVTIHYFEYMSDFYFPGEFHDFWELLCVDKGEVDVVADKDRYTLKKDEVIFHKPNEFHNVKAGKNAPNLVVISFLCDSKSMHFFENRILVINEIERQLFAQIINEAKNTYVNRLNDPYYEKLNRAESVPFGAEQLIKTCLEQVLILLYRRYHLDNSINNYFNKTVEKSTETALKEVLIYLENNMPNHITIQEICKNNLISRSQLQKMFHSNFHCGVIDYFNKIKVDEAKQLIRNRNMNFTQIADYLGYSSIHYFSRQFKNITGMNPTEYAYSIKVLSEKS